MSTSDVYTLAGRGSTLPGIASLFCRHNRFTADCPICSKGTVLDSSAPEAKRRAPAKPKPPGAKRRPGDAMSAAARVTGPYASAGPYEDEQGERYEVRLERVPGGLRLAEWAAGALRRRAPVLAAADLRALVASARETVLSDTDAERLGTALAAEPAGNSAAHGASRGRAGDMQEELRVEALDDGRLRIARWVLRPGSGWELQEAPPMLPAKRYADAFASAARAGLLSGS